MSQIIAAFDEPAGATPRGTLVVLPGRGETATSYQRFGRRLSFDNYKVRVVGVDLDDLDATRTEIEKLLADESLPTPKVLIGTDTGASLVADLFTPGGSAGPAGVDAVVIAGIALPDSRGVRSWDDEVEARTACPVHRKVIGEDASFGRGSLEDPLPAQWADLTPVTPPVPTLVLHGNADPITPLEAAVAPYRDGVRVRIVDGGRHDVLNDIMHRSVAATIVLFLESLRLGADLPAIVVPA
jgi:alpha-beta hydrolase superfamily lysophospholipase